MEITFHTLSFIAQFINLLILVLSIYLIVRLIVKAGNWFHWRRKHEEEIIRKLDELIELQQASLKDKERGGLR